ncbi:ImmA/IrrE family metallo-endopeptidase [Saccharopolyspora terrae]|uniref:ImmA/IrrE family metallo-endopeptidase n=1 Tax=Saccharopolyspora terrae TaxID=2530384 RepID=A0A4R4W4V4_9PSEU|nr:XRE family transcriptional regulator [Saccharopolyspora terrae]TDD10604.1 ImmA/IrrE family metallo-endopeptidase [Saccharopolyspora terrae]
MLAVSPGERLRTLRHLLGFTQAELAKVTGVQQSWISEVEGLSREPAIERLELIAEVTATPIEFFYIQPKDVPLDSLRFRKKASASKVVTQRVHALYGESYRVSDTLISEEGYPTPPLPFATEEEVTQDRIQELASQAREALRLAPDKPIPNLTRAMERAGIAVAPFVLPNDTNGSSSTCGHDGLSYWGGVGETALVGYFPGQPGDRERFTLAHELGHLVLHTFRPFAMEAEMEAHNFASALLVPQKRALRDINERKTLTDYARMKATWGVSIQSLIKLGHTLDLVSEKRYRSLYVQLSAKGWRKEEPVAVGNESPVLLQKLLYRRFGDRPYAPGSHHLAFPVSLLRSIIPPPKKQRPKSAGPKNRSLAVVKDISAR